MERILRILIYLIVLGIVLAGASFYFANEFYHKMVAEDGFFENLTAIILLVISLLFFIRLVKTWRTRNRYWILLNVIIILGTFFGFGEEISWGQRIFSIESGEFFSQHNLQNETNLHNLKIGDVKINKLIFSQGFVVIFGFYFLFSLLLYRKWAYFNRIVDLWGVQIPKLIHSIVLLACIAFITQIPDSRLWELWEALFVVILLLVFLEPYNQKEKLIMYK